jgi:hypothetical protein
MNYSKNRSEKFMKKFLQIVVIVGFIMVIILLFVIICLPGGLK